MTTPIYQAPAAQSLAEAYVQREHNQAKALFTYHTDVEKDWQNRYDWLQNSVEQRVPARELAKMLTSFNEQYGKSSGITESIEKIANGSPVIVGGQQAGLWTGPLLVVHKAVSIIGAARSASEQLGVPVVPVFWIAGEDHDWDEANHAYFLNAQQELTKLTASREEGVRTSVSRTIMEDSQWENLVRELEQVLPFSEHKEGLIAELRSMTATSRTLSDLFAQLLHRLFEGQGLVLMDADYPQLRTLEKPMFKQMVEKSDELERAYFAMANKLESCGYPLQADVSPGAANLFVFSGEAQSRTLLFKEEGSFVSRKRDVHFSKDELLQFIDDQPERMSNNVLTRPLMQDYVLPVLGTVLGNGEIAYWALTTEAFGVVGLQQPIIVPRMSFTLVEGIIARNMEKYELSFADVMERFEERRSSWLAAQDEHGVAGQFAALKEQFSKLYEPVLATATAIQPGLGKLGETNRSKILDQITYMEGKTLDAFEQQFAAGMRQLDRIASSLRPDGKQQERVLNMLAYWNRYGLDWLDKLLDAPYSRNGGHVIIYL